MTIREFYLQRQREELPVFIKVLRALPKDRLDYKPDDLSPSAEQIVWTITKAFQVCSNVLISGEGEWKEVPAPPIDEMIEQFERISGEITERVAGLTETDWDKPAKFYYGGKMVSEQPTGTFFWFVLFDAIHHRGQLAAYLRPMGGKVPGIYGPSADEKKSATAG